MHDQNFKNLILDYPFQALAFFASEEAHYVETARIIPIRQEQLKERLGERFRELDTRNRSDTLSFFPSPFKGEG